MYTPSPPRGFTAAHAPRPLCATLLQGFLGVHWERPGRVSLGVACIASSDARHGVYWGRDAGVYWACIGGVMRACIGPPCKGSPAQTHTHASAVPAPSPPPRHSSPDISLLDAESLCSTTIKPARNRLPDPSGGLETGPPARAKTRSPVRRDSDT